jgi:hypothetical protein
MYSKQASPNPLGTAKQVGEAGRPVGEGQWMIMPQAIAATGLTERTLRRHVQKGWVKFRKLGNPKKPRIELWITPEIGNFGDQIESGEQEDAHGVDIFDVSSDSIDGEVFDTTPEPTASSQAVETAEGSIRSRELETIVSAITGKFLERLDKTNEMLFELRGELQDKDRQLKLLPDLQKEAEERQLAELKAIALEKQIEELKLLNEKLIKEAEQGQAVHEKKSWWKSLFSAGSTEKA